MVEIVANYNCVHQTAYHYVGTGGNVSGETIRRYIERSEHLTQRR